MEVIDLRSDFLARPSEAMLRAAARANGDPLHFGLREDPWQRRLEASVARMVGMEDALIFPTCTMANTTGMMLAAAPGSAVLTQPGAHVLLSEAGAGTALGGLVLTAVDGVTGGGSAAMPALSSWEEAMGAPADAQRPAVRLCVLENTHNRSGGVAIPPVYIDAVVGMARRQGIALHLDGSRLFYAAQALGVEVPALARGFDTVSVSLNKTVGAPVAAVLAGPAALIERALVIRQRLGGGLRPTGVACAASLAGLDELDQLGDVVAHARRLREGLSACPGLSLQAPGVTSNLVMAELHGPTTSAEAVKRMDALGLKALAMDARRIRFALYRGIQRPQIERALSIVTEAMEAA
ncbi:MAG: Low-specificity L-threonine aldolase [Ramlibacter sp.]|nr:Low-specificity L-threonine aldolase [Ramlibacter sp.]